MSATLTQFKIENLHGRRTIDIPIIDNRLVLVGENGVGKSTVVNLIYFFLTRQWKRLREYEFFALEACVSGQTLRITLEDTQLLINRGRRLHQVGLPFASRRTRQLLLDFDLDAEDIGPVGSVRYRRLVEGLSEQMEMPQEFVQDFLHHQIKAQKLPAKLAQTVEILKSLDFGQFLYLPTYRRIEHDLKSIFRGVEIEEQVREFRERIKKRRSSAYIELVEFGMEDVEKTIADRMAKIKENVRTGLNNLTGTYLREVLRGLDDPANDAAVLQTIDPKVFESIFARIDETTLPSEDKALLRSRVASISPGYNIGSGDKVIAHFLSKLVALHRQQQQSEMDVRAFAELCNAYLAGKQLIYDDVHYNIFIRQQADSHAVGDTEKTDRLELRMLSSGEKQIVSLFSHIYLSGDNNYFVIIDEPELSLSVPWQQRFLPDIIGTKRCTGLLAVTHSPFIWENELEGYVRSLSQFIDVPNVVR